VILIKDPLCDCCGSVMIRFGDLHRCLDCSREIVGAPCGLCGEAWHEGDCPKPVAPVVDLAAVRHRRKQKEGEASNAGCESFAFRMFVPEDDSIGYADGKVFVILDPASLKGIGLTPDDARSLGLALIECAYAVEHDDDAVATPEKK